jgi:uncharacterized integral membrane protein
MPWRLIEFIIVFAVFLVFIAFNLGNKCDINFGFRVIKDAPVFLTAFSSFILGMLCAFPFVFSLRAKKKAKAGKEGGDSSAPAAKKKWGKKKEEPLPELDPGSPGDGGPYGIN